jgi:hypothetical protein
MVYASWLIQVTANYMWPAAEKNNYLGAPAGMPPLPSRGGRANAVMALHSHSCTAARKMSAVFQSQQ